MLKFTKSTNHEIVICPRWPSTAVYITTASYEQLKKAQLTLTLHGLRLVLTRGYENESRFLKFLRRYIRRIGGAIFCFVYPDRSNEREAIFCPNGHDKSGDCVDICVLRGDKILKFLPYGVFTPQKILSVNRQKNGQVLSLVWQALEAAGFVIHSNATEAMQIHCEMTNQKVGDELI